MSKITSFPFTFIDKTKLGKIYRPYAIFFFWSKTRNRWQPIEMVIDTGADYTLLPKKYSLILGINLIKDCSPETTLGIGGGETVYQYPKLLVKLGNWQKKIPVGFLERDNIPPLLGRLGCLEVFRLVMENKTTYFEKS